MRYFMLSMNKNYSEYEINKLTYFLSSPEFKLIKDYSLLINFSIIEIKIWFIEYAGNDYSTINRADKNLKKNSLNI